MLQLERILQIAISILQMRTSSWLFLANLYFHLSYCTVIENAVIKIDVSVHNGTLRRNRSHSRYSIGEILRERWKLDPITQF